MQPSVEKQRPLLPRLVAATILFAGASCINAINLRISAVVPNLRPSAVKTSTTSEDIEMDEALKSFGPLGFREEDVGSGSSLRAVDNSIFFRDKIYNALWRPIQKIPAICE